MADVIWQKSMHEYYQIKDAVSSLLNADNYKEKTENTEVDYCGSIQTIFVSGEKRVLLGWDGEEGFGYAEVWENGDWRMLPTKVLEDSSANFKVAIEKLCSNIRGYL